MKEDAQLICPVSYVDKDDVWPVVQKFVCDHLPLKDVTWKSPISASFVNIEKLPLRFLPASSKLFHETQHPYRRFLAPYVHLYLLCAESMDAYKQNRTAIKKWMEAYNNVKIGRQPWLIVYVPTGTSTADVYGKIYAKLCADFYTDRAGDRCVMLVVPPDSRRPSEKAGQQSLFQQAYAALAGLLGKLRDGVVASFQLRAAQYDADIRKLDSLRGTAQFDFWQLFLVKESLALMYQMLQLPDRSMALYEELEALLPFAPVASLPDNDWPMVAVEKEGAASSKEGAEGGRSPTRSRGSDLMSAACRNGEEVVAYSINQARMHILWNKFSLLQLQHYVFARQMHFLLVHLRQPTRCAEKALAYIRAAGASLEAKMQAQLGIVFSEQDHVRQQLLQLKRAQADTWLLMAALKLARECRALLQLLVGGESRADLQLSYSVGSRDSQSVGGRSRANSHSHNPFYDHGGRSLSGTGGSSSMHALTAAVAHGGGPGLPGGPPPSASAWVEGGTVSMGSLGSMAAMSQQQQREQQHSTAFQGNLNAVREQSAHADSVLFSSLDELSRSQQVISHAPTGQGRADGSPQHNPSAVLREVLFGPLVDAEEELRDSSRVLSDLLAFALQRLRSLSSTVTKAPDRRAVELAAGLDSLLPVRWAGQDQGVGVQGVPILSKPPHTRHTPPSSPKQATGSVSGTGAGAGASLGAGLRTNPVVQNFSSGAHLPAPSPFPVHTPSPRIADSLEKELSLVDGVEWGGTVGERADQLLQTLSQKVRSTSHFWSKLYEAMPGLLSSLNSLSLLPDSTSSPSGKGGPETGVGGGGEKPPLRRNSGSGLTQALSRTHLDMGRMLELCLAVLGGAAQAHMQLLAHRPRFAVCSILRSADLLLCNGQYALAARRFDEALRSGLLAPGAQYISSAGGVVAAGTDVQGTAGTRQRLGLIHRSAALDQQRHRAAALSAGTGAGAGPGGGEWGEGEGGSVTLGGGWGGLAEGGAALGGCWLELRHWALRKLLFCVARGEQGPERFRLVAANLLMAPCSDDTLLDGDGDGGGAVGGFGAEGSSAPLPLPPLLPPVPLPTAGKERVTSAEVLLPLLLQELVALCSVSTASSSSDSSGSSGIVGAAGSGQVYEGEAAPTAPLCPPMLLQSLSQSPPCPRLLRLPLRSYFDFQMGMLQARHIEGAKGAVGPEGGADSPRLVRGFEVLREDWLPATAMQVAAGSGGFLLPLLLRSRLPGPVPVHRVAAVFRRFSSRTVLQQMAQPAATGAGMGTGSGFGGMGAGDGFDAGLDEIVCEPEAGGVRVLGPGLHTLQLLLPPPPLGDFHLHRVLLLMGSALFQTVLLPGLGEEGEGGSAGEGVEGGNGQASLLQAQGQDPGQGQEEEQVQGKVQEQGGLFSPAPAGAAATWEGMAVAALRLFLRQHPLIHVRPPAEALCAQAWVASLVPLAHTDDAYFRLSTGEDDCLRDVRITAWSKGDAVAGANGVSRPSTVGGGVGGKASSDTGVEMQGSAPSPCWDEGQSTFVPLHLATPARRKRQALPLDHEDPALAHAAAMLSLLLAEEASELRARGKQTTGGVELRVLPTEHWAVFQAPSADVSKDRGKAVVRLHGAACVDAATEEAAARAVELSAHSPASTPSSSFSSSASPSTPSDGRALCLEGEVPPLSQLLVRLPFRTMLRGAGLGGGGEVTVVVAVTAQLMRGGCLIPLRLERECTVRVVSPLRLQLETFPCGDDSGGGGEVLVQALLLNDSPVSLQLVGYGVAAGGRGGGEGGLRVLDGPCQLPLLPDAELPVQTQAEAEVKAGADEGGCVALLPLEEYPLGVLLALPPSPSPSPSVVFYYRRGAEASNGKGVGMGIGMGELPRELLLQRCFRVSCALPLPTSAPSAPSVPAPAPHFELQVWASPSQTQAQSLPAALEAGRLSRHLYELTVTVGRGGGGGCTQWQWPCPITASTATSVSPPATLRSLGGLWVAAAACETGAWVAGGLSFRVLSALPLSLVGQEQEGQEKGLGQEQGVGRVRVRFLLEVELLPVFAGLLPLPPLRLQYALREQEQWQGGEDVFEEVLHPSRLRGADCVLVLPASTSASNSSSAPASSTRTHASRLCPAEASAE